jgi:amino acid permease
MINFFGVKGYGEAEFVFSIVKVTAVIGYMYEPVPLCLLFLLILGPPY